MNVVDQPSYRPRNPQVDMMEFRKLVERVEALESLLVGKKRGKPAKEKDNGDPDQ